MAARRLLAVLIAVLCVMGWAHVAPELAIDVDADAEGISQPDDHVTQPAQRSAARATVPAPPSHGTPIPWFVASGIASFSAQEAVSLAFARVAETPQSRAHWFIEPWAPRGPPFIA